MVDEWFAKPSYTACFPVLVNIFDLLDGIVLIMFPQNNSCRK